MTAIFQEPVPTIFRGLDTPQQPSDSVNKAYVDSRVGGTILSAIILALIPSDATVYLPLSEEGVGNTVIYVTGDVSTIFPVGTFIGFLTDPNPYLISNVTVTTVAPIQTIITLSSPLRYLLTQTQFIYKYRLDGTAIQRIILDPSFVQSNDNGNFWIQNKFNILFGTTLPTVDTFGFLGQLYVLKTIVPNTDPTVRLFTCITDNEQTPFTWIEISGGGSGVGATFGSTSVIVANFRNYTTQPNGDAWIPTDSPNRLFGAALMAWGVTTNQFSENTGEGLINGVRYIGSVQDYDDNRGNGLIFPQNLSPKTNIDFKFSNSIFKFDCVFATPLQTGGVGLDFIIANASVITNLQNPTDYAIAFFNGGEGDERINWLNKPVITVVNNVVAGVTVSTVTVTGGNGYIKGDWNGVDYIGSQDPYYLFVVVNDTTSGTNACTSMRSVVMSQDTSICSYAMDMFIGLQGQTGNGTGGGSTITSNSLTVTNPTATSTEIEVPSGKTLVKYITQPTPGKAVQYIDLLGNIYTINTNDTTVATTDPTNTTVGNQGDSILNTSNTALWIQITPVVTPQTYNWVRVNPSNQIQLLTGSIAPVGTIGNNGDFYLQYNKLGLVFSTFQKIGGLWLSSAFLPDVAKNITSQGRGRISFSDLADANLYPDFIQNTLIPPIINVANTVTILEYSTLFVTVTTTGVSDNDYATLQTNINIGRAIQFNGARAGSLIGSWKMIVDSIEGTNVIDNRTVIISGHLLTRDEFSLLAFDNALVGTKTDSTWSYTGSGLFALAFVPDLSGMLLGIGSDGFLTLVNVPAAANNIQTFRTSANSVGALIIVPFNTAVISLGTAFGSMNNGVFTFNRAVTCTVNVVLNVSSDPDGWGTINGVWTNTRYNQYSGTSSKGAFSQIITFNSGDTYSWRPNNNVTVYGTGGTNTFIEFKALN